MLGWLTAKAEPLRAQLSGSAGYDLLVFAVALVMKRAESSPEPVRTTECD